MADAGGAVDFRILGPLEVVAGGRRSSSVGRSCARCWRCCCSRRTASFPSDRLIDALWDEAPPATAQKALQVYVSQLRKLLGSERIQRVGPGYLLAVGAEELDLARFERLRDEGSRTRRSRSGAGRRSPTSPTSASRRPRSRGWRSCASRALEERIDADLAAGRHAELVGELERARRPSTRCASACAAS